MDTRKDSGRIKYHKIRDKIKITIREPEKESWRRFGEGMNSILYLQMTLAASNHEPNIYWKFSITKFTLDRKIWTKHEYDNNILREEIGKGVEGTELVRKG